MIRCCDLFDCMVSYILALFILLFIVLLYHYLFILVIRALEREIFYFYYDK